MSEVLHDRVSRKTGTRTTVVRDGGVCLVSCEHGVKMEKPTFGAAMHAAKNSDEWCDACADGKDEVRPQRRARIEWTDGRQMMRQLVDDATGEIIATGIFSATNLHLIVRSEWLEIDDPGVTEPDEPDPNWDARAACKGMRSTAFFEEAWQPNPVPPRRSKGFQAARAVCFTCPVRAECRDAALELPAAKRLGVQGGYDPTEIAAMEERCTS